MMMQADLFSADLANLTESDICEFLGIQRQESLRPPEGTTIDYKEHLPSDIGDDVAAMSNTYGGLIFIGVKADKKKQNIPVAMDGDKIGADAKSRITDKVIATVHPRPQIEIGIVPISASDTVVAVLRVRKGQIPPYQFEQGAAVRIPIRVNDTNRQARMGEIEDMFHQRQSLESPASNLRESLSGIESMKHTTQDATGQVYDIDYQSIFLIPRAPLTLRLDSRLEKEFEGIITRSSPRDHLFFDHTRRGAYHHLEATNHSVIYRRAWRIWSSGAVGLVATFTGELGDIAADFISFFRVARLLQEQQGYFGPSVLDHTLSCRNIKLEARFPPPGNRGDYDFVDGIQLPDSKPEGSSLLSRNVQDVEWSELGAPDELVADILLAALRETWQAKVDYPKLLEAIARLSRD